jgi:hypothetical protein
VKGVDDPRYVPPPAFAPPQLRVAPLNETAVLGHTSYPAGPYAPPLGYPAPGIAPGVTWQRPQQDQSARRRTVSVVVSVCVIVALATIGIVVSTASVSHRAHTLHLPQAFDTYTRVTTLQGSQVQSMFTAGAATFAGIGTDDLTDALVAVYADISDSSPSVLFIGFTAKASPTIGPGLRAGPPGSIAEQVLGGAGAATGPQSVNAGPLGGAMRCATVDLGGDTASVGVWADADTLGIVLIDNSSLTTSGNGPSTQLTSTLTRELRAAAEH